MNGLRTGWEPETAIIDRRCGLHHLISVQQCPPLERRRMGKTTCIIRLPVHPSPRSGRRGGGLPSAPEGQWQGRGDLLPVEGSPGTPLSPCPEPQLCDVNPSQAAAPGMLSGQALRTLSWSRRQAALQINRPGRAP